MLIGLFGEFGAAQDHLDSQITRVGIAHSELNRTIDKRFYEYEDISRPARA